MQGGVQSAMGQRVRAVCVLGAAMVVAACSSDSSSRRCVSQSTNCTCGDNNRESGEVVDKCDVHSVYGNGRCQQRPSNLACICAPYRCSTQSFGCACSIGETEDGPACNKTGSYPCCLDYISPATPNELFAYCACYNFADSCTSKQVQVPDCSVTSVDAAIQSLGSQWSSQWVQTCSSGT